MLRHLSVRLKSLFHRERLEQELDTELQYHLDMLIEQNLKAGMSTLEARRAALRVFGPVAGVKDDVRDTWMSRFVETAAQDIRYGVRNLGATQDSRFDRSADDGARNRREHRDLQRGERRAAPPAALQDGDRIVVLRQGRETRSPTTWAFHRKNWPTIAAPRSFSDVVEFHNMFFTLLGRAEPERVSTGVVSANFFDVLGVSPMYGRGFVEADEAQGAPAVLVLSHKYWQRSFGGDPKIVGQVFRMNDRPHTVIGMLPAVPQYPLDVDVYMPTSACPFRSQRARDRQSPVPPDADRLRAGQAGGDAQQVPARISTSSRRDWPRTTRTITPTGFPRHRRRPSRRTSRAISR